MSTHALHGVSADPVAAFRQAIADAGLTAPERIEADGRLHRFGTGGTGKAGFYVLHLDGLPAGHFGCYRAGVSGNWHATPGRPLTTAEQRANHDRITAMRKQREAAEAEQRKEARQRAAAIWDGAEPAPADHGYLCSKDIKPHGARVHDGSLIVPMYADGELQSIQRIKPDGQKRFLTGGRTAGCCFSIGEPGATVCIAEGFATAASIHQATGYACVVAFSAGNLMTVTKIIKAAQPNARLVVCADNDPTDGNPGVTAATKAAQAVGACLAVPPTHGDFNDMSRTSGAAAVRANIEAARKVEDRPAKLVTLQCGANITPEPIAWEWPGWLARGKVQIIAGAPGTGKTTAAMSFAGTISKGGQWPDGARAAVGNVVIWSGEDDPADTLVPRLLAAGADLSRVHFVGSVSEAGGCRPFDPAQDMTGLQEAIAARGSVRLLIVDPIVSAIAGDSHKNAEVRRGLQPLVDLAAQTDCALLGVTHLSKGTAGRDPIERINGSLAFGALARLVMLAARRQEADGGPARLLVRAKSNIGPDDGGFGYDLQQIDLQEYPGITASRVKWGAPIEGDARSLLADADVFDDDRSGGTLTQAKQFLEVELATGPVLCKQVLKSAKDAGYSEKTIRRAKDTLGIESRKDGMAGGWSWALPRRWPEHPQSENVATFGNSGHLRDDSGHLQGNEIEVEI